jgi:hypothetical protein
MKAGVERELEEIRRNPEKVSKGDCGGNPKNGSETGSRLGGQIGGQGNCVQVPNEIEEGEIFIPRQGNERGSTQKGERARSW